MSPNCKLSASKGASSFARAAQETAQEEDATVAIRTTAARTTRLAMKSRENPGSVRVASTDICQTSTRSNKLMHADIGVYARLSSDAHGKVTNPDLGKHVLARANGPARRPQGPVPGYLLSLQKVDHQLIDGGEPDTTPLGSLPAAVATRVNARADRGRCCRSVRIRAGISRPSARLQGQDETWACSSRRSACSRTGIAHFSPRV